MFNLKVNGIVATAAFILSFLIGLVSGTAMPLLIIRPLIFAAVFFIITGLVYYLVNQFLPELLDGSGPAEDKDFHLGSHINITEGDSPGLTSGFTSGFTQGDFPGKISTPDGQGFVGAQADDSEEGLGNISDLLGKVSVSSASGEETQGGTPGGTPTGLDQNAQSEYNKAGEIEEFSEPEPLSYSGDRSTGPGLSVPARPTVPSGTDEEVSDSVDFLPDLESMAGAFLSHLTGEEPDTTEYTVSTPSRKSPSGAKSPQWAGDFNAKDMAEGLRTVLHKEKEG